MRLSCLLRLLAISLVFLPLAQALNASEATRQQYLELIRQFPNVVHPRGSADQGEIEIITDEDRMAAIEARMGRDVGIMARDRYWIWINDACLFPNGREWVYGRILWVKALESTPGVVVMPILPDGTVVLNCNFRHATRSWEMELPRGVINIGETMEEAARRETMEETGMDIDRLVRLGEVCADSGMTSTVNPIFMARVVKRGESQQEDSEAIEAIITLSLDEIKQAFVWGHYDCNIRGIERRVAFRDPFLAYAIFMYDLKEERGKGVRSDIWTFEQGE